MNKTHQKRLLNVARALRESRDPRAFTMERFAHGCGTPACALGHYASRRDLQRAFRIDPEPAQESWTSYERLVLDGLDNAVYPDDYQVTDHFGLSIDEGCELFDVYGCGGARTPIQAARYIERFVARKQKEAGRGR